MSERDPERDEQDMRPKQDHIQAAGAWTHPSRSEEEVRIHERTTKKRGDSDQARRALNVRRAPHRAQDNRYKKANPSKELAPLNQLPKDGGELLRLGKDGARIPRVRIIRDEASKRVGYTRHKDSSHDFGVAAHEPFISKKRLKSEWDKRRVSQ